MSAYLAVGVIQLVVGEELGEKKEGEREKRRVVEEEEERMEGREGKS